MIPPPFEPCAVTNEQGTMRMTMLALFTDGAGARTSGEIFVSARTAQRFGAVRSQKVVG